MIYLLLLLILIAICSEEFRKFFSELCIEIIVFIIKLTKFLAIPTAIIIVLLIAYLIIIK